MAEKSKSLPNLTKPGLIGRLLSKVQTARWLAKEEAVKDLWERNGLGNPTKRQGYKLEETKRVGMDGSEATTLRLWKLVDQSVVIVESQVIHRVETGIPREEVDNADSRQSEDSSTESPI